VLALTVAAGAFGAGWWVRGLDDGSTVDARKSKGQKLIPQAAGWELKTVSVAALCQGRGKHSIPCSGRRGEVLSRLA
jgi:hypothetical protein